MTRNQILNGWLEYSPQELANFIKQGVISLDDLINECEIDVKTEDDIRAELTRDLMLSVFEMLTSDDVAQISAFLQQTGAVLDSEQKRKLQERITWLEERENMARLEQIERQSHEEWERIRFGRNIDDIKNFKQRNPAYSRMDEVDALLEELYWDDVHRQWEQLRSMRPDEEALERFKQQYPTYPRIEEVNRLIHQLRNAYTDIDELVEEIQSANSPYTVIQNIEEALTFGGITKAEFIDELERNPNLLSAGVLRVLEERGLLSRLDLSQVYGRDLIKVYSRNEPSVSFAYAEPIAELQTPFNEVYFWGIPSSGKTCALGALLSTLNNVFDDDCAWSAVQPLSQCQGYAYLNQLKTLFRGQNKYFQLPQSTPSGSIYEMSFEINSKDGRKTWPVSFIDLAGELFRAMYLSDTGGTLSQDLESGLQVLRNVFSNNTKHSNRKVHFFVLEYGGHNRFYDGHPQEVYLQAAVNWLERLGVFNMGTDAIYLIITKCDKIGDEDMHSHLKHYLETEYAGFYRSLKMICQKYEINGKQLEVFPFSIGEVYMQTYCKFSPDYAVGVLNEVLKHAAPKPNKGGGILDILFGSLNQ